MALQSLCTLLRTEEGIHAAQGLAPKLWPQMLSLLSDPAAAVRQNAAIAVGLVGAVASRPPLIAGTFPGDTTPHSHTDSELQERYMCEQEIIPANLIL
jgi:hypothetical protein